MAVAPGGSPGSAAPETLDAQARRVDPDRWLASRFVHDADRRDALVALSALNDELARVGETVTQPLLGEIRLAWWRDQIGEVFDGAAAPRHPVLQALRDPIRGGALPRPVFEAMIQARHADLESNPFDDQAALVAYLDGTAGALMGLATRALDPQAPLADVVQAGRAWGLAGLYRSRDSWRARNRDWVPQGLGHDDADGAGDPRARRSGRGAEACPCGDPAPVGDGLSRDRLCRVGQELCARPEADGAGDARPALVLATAMGRI